jgi:hypothetical protein
MKWNKISEFDQDIPSGEVLLWAEIEMPTET